MARARNREIVVVTGASAGVGRAVVRRFARAGAWLGLIARGRAGLEAARREVEALGGRALVFPSDVTDATALEETAERVEAELGPIDVWVNDAMVTVFGEFQSITAEEFHRVTEVTYLGYVNGTRAALARMMPRDRGTIVQVGSALAYRSIPLQSAYCGAKHAIQGFTESVRTELLHRRSRVWISMVQLPAVNTPQFAWCRSRMPRKAQPVPPIYEPEIPAEGVYFAAHHRRREVFVGASTAIVIEGNKVAPAVGDHYLGRTGYDSQMYDGRESAERPDNLFNPMDAASDVGPHGVFGDRAKRRSVQLWASMHRRALGTVGASLAVVALVFGLR